MATTRPRQARSTHIGDLVVERGLLSRVELDAVLERFARSPHGIDSPRVGEALVADRYLSADLLDQILESQKSIRAGGPSEVERPTKPIETPVDLAGCLTEVLKRGAHELLVVSGRRPAVRLDDRLVVIGSEPISAGRVREFAHEAFTVQEIEAAESGTAATKTIGGATPTGAQADGHARFRAHLEVGEHGLVITCRPLCIGLDDKHALKLPADLAALADLQRGLIVVAGAGRAARAEVLARMIARMNEKSQRHIITIEREMRYEHESLQSLIAQREVGRHTESYVTALRAALREDPDVMAVGEIWDSDAIATALLAAETGHLVVCSLHATEAVQAIRRIIDSQGAARGSLVRMTLANVLRAVAVIDVVPGKQNERFLVADLVPGTAPVTRMIREDRLHHLYATGASTGVVLRDDSLAKLLASGRVTRAVAIEHAMQPTLVADVHAPV